MKDIGRKLLDVSELPEGPMTRMIRGSWYGSNREKSFEDYKKDWEAKYDEDCRVRNIEHPIEFNKEIRIDQYKTVQFFKRKGEEWMCSECDMAPNGGSGSVSLEEALRMVGKTNISEI